MSRYIILLTLGLALTLVLASGCTDRGTNAPDRQVSEGVVMEALEHDFFTELILQIGRNTSTERASRVPLQIKMYTPEVSVTPIGGGQAKPVPLLILLPPQDGNVYYFFNHGLIQIADELIAEGTIQPMAIACVENDPVFGGYFYAGHSPAAGNYDALFGGPLLEHLYKIDKLNESLPVGIGGVGMGAYGAFRAALMHQGVFTSISGTDGPFDFDSFEELFVDALMEQGLLGGTTEPPTIDTAWQCDSTGIVPAGWVCASWYVDTVGWQCTSWQFDTQGDSTCIDSSAIIYSTCIELVQVFDTICVDSSIVAIDTTFLPSWREKLDTAGVWHLSRLLIGGALAFSPHDTMVDTSGIHRVVTDPIDGSEFLKYNIPDSQRFTIDDTVTLITEVVKEDQFNFDFHLPFDSFGAPYPLIWDMWLKNNLETILTDSGSAQLDGVRMWIATTPEYAFANYREQTLSWIETLRNSGFDTTQLVVREYTGYPGNPATNDQYIYDLLREMLIFHSKAFEKQ